MGLPSPLKEATGKTTSNHFRTDTSPSALLWLCQGCQGETDRSLFNMHCSPTIRKQPSSLSKINSIQQCSGMWRKWRLQCWKSICCRLNQKEILGAGGVGVPCISAPWGAKEGPGLVPLSHGFAGAGAMRSLAQLHLHMSKREKKSQPQIQMLDLEIWDKNFFVHLLHQQINSNTVFWVWDANLVSVTL